MTRYAVSFTSLLAYKSLFNEVMVMASSVESSENFGTLNELARKNLVRGLPMLKYDKDHLCPSCQLGKSKKASHPLKTENTNTEVLNTLHMDLCGPMRTERRCRKNRNEPPLFLWAEAVATGCYTLNRSLVHTLHGKTYYELLNGKQPNLQYFRVFGSLCYPTNDYADVGKLKAKADIGIFVGYAPTKKAYRIYNKRTRKIQETVHVAFDELTEGMTSVQTSSGLAPQQMTSVQTSSGLAPQQMTSVQTSSGLAPQQMTSVQNSTELELT
ncbi:retrovirus-related pol polyprotein from transposon TNT 1-94, partial [Tanacetum coccineum]